MPWARRKVANLGRVTLDQNYTSGSGTMELTTGNNAFIPTTGIFWLSWSEDETDPDAVIHIFRVTAVSGDDVSVTAETSEGGGDTNITAGQILRVSVPISAVNMLGMVYLAELTASTSASLDFATVVSDNTDYDVFQIQLKSLRLATDNVFMMMRMSVDGSTFDSGNNYKYYNFAWSAGGSGIDQADNTSHIRFSQAEAWDNTQTTYSYNSTVNLYNPASAALWKFVNGNSIYVGQADLPAAHVISGVYKVATAVTGFQFIPSSGNIASGTIRVYGLAKG